MDISKIRKDFPALTENLVYLDTAASSLKVQSVIDKVNYYYKELGTNVHRGVYNISFEATKLYEASRDNVAKFINAKTEEVVFTRGTSSALNLVASSYGLLNINEGDEIIVSELEHHSSILPWLNVSKRKKAKLNYVTLSEEGRITVENFKKVLTSKTKVVALTYVSNVMGYITPIKEITKLAHEVGAIVIVDAAQAVPHKKVDVKEIDCDFLAFSGHKMCGPTGIGVLFGKKKLLDKMEPIEFGGDMNDNVDKYDALWKDAPYKFETGTPPIAQAIGLNEAINYLEKIGPGNILEYERKLKDYTVKKLLEIDDVIVYNESAETGIIAFNIDGVHPHDVATSFDSDNLCLRAGHHCAQLVIKWLNVVATLRASFYIYNTYEDCDRFVDSVKNARNFFKEVGF